MVNAHDLLWGMTPAHVPADAPAWVLEALGAGHPVVVRRAIAEPGYVAVGVRGRLREQRFAAQMPLALVRRRVTPPSTPSSSRSACPTPMARRKSDRPRSPCKLRESCADGNPAAIVPPVFELSSIAFAYVYAARTNSFLLNRRFTVTAPEYCTPSL